jgi:RHS repeat-associated protein
MTVTAPGGGVTSYTFDANGNQTGAGAMTFTYDRADRLRTAIIGNTTETYTYWGDGTRRSASTGAQANKTTRFVWDRSQALPQIALERNGSDSLLRAYAYSLDLVSQKAGSKTFYYHHDGLGSVADVTGSTGTSLIWSEYYPYGLVRQSGIGQGAPTNPFNFAGEQRDETTGLYHLRARQYDPGTGRFLTTDPAAAAISDPSLASYVYVLDNPTLLADPSGRVVPCIGAAAAGAVTGGAAGTVAPVVGNAAGVTVGAILGFAVCAIGIAVAGTVVVGGAAVAGNAVGEALSEARRSAQPPYDPRQDPEIFRRQMELERGMYSGRHPRGSLGPSRLPPWCAQHPARCAAFVGVTVGTIYSFLWASLQGRDPLDPSPRRSTKP